MESQTSGSCLGWCQPRIDAGGSQGGLAPAASWSTFRTHPRRCYGVVQPDLPRPSSLSVGCSQSPKKSKTPPLPKSERPGKVPHGRSLQAHLGNPWLDSWGTQGSLDMGLCPRSCSFHPFIHSLIRSFSRNVLSTCVPGSRDHGRDSDKLLLPWSLRAREGSADK